MMAPMTTDPAGRGVARVRIEHDLAVSAQPTIVVNGTDIGDNVRACTVGFEEGRLPTVQVALSAGVVYDGPGVVTVTPPMTDGQVRGQVRRLIAAWLNAQDWRGIVSDAAETGPMGTHLGDAIHATLVKALERGDVDG